jgi:predicted RNA-binding protein with PIN domain
LAELIGRSRFQREATCLVCDGPARGRPTADLGSIVFHYAGSQSSADAVIAKMVDGCSAPRRMTVVTSDRAILKHAKRRRCPTISANEFLEILARDHAAAGRGPRNARGGSGARGSKARPQIDPLTQQQIEAWKVYFGLDDPKKIEALKLSAREGPAHRKPHDRRTPKQL